jgi:hypothetical protein
VLESGKKLIGKIFAALGHFVCIGAENDETKVKKLCCI